MSDDQPQLIPTDAEIERLRAENAMLRARLEESDKVA
ncbi:hypothetical protein SAMN06265795_11619 [Noviherbaspirillum humi]|uniref:Uncharacterized protein n=1 Tax=Noviherbaspirillum humi TaxID=1688639 RepID=A0A239KK87_9BURK|nr:hypothetical protein SAMN06265795_11619 [Noviherbaspirillum humi]